MRGDVAQAERLRARAQVDEAVDDAHGRGRALAAAEVHGGRATQDPVRADDADGDDEDEQSHDPAVLQERDHEQSRDERRPIKESRGRRAPRMEDLVADEPREHPARDARDHQHEPPVVAGVLPAPGEPGQEVLLGEDPEPLIDAVADGAGAELDAGDGEDDRDG